MWKSAQDFLLSAKSSCCWMSGSKTEIRNPKSEIFLNFFPRHQSLRRVCLTFWCGAFKIAKTDDLYVRGPGPSQGWQKSSYTPRYPGVLSCTIASVDQYFSKPVNFCDKLSSVKRYLPFTNQKFSYQIFSLWSYSYSAFLITVCTTTSVTPRVPLQPPSFGTPWAPATGRPPRETLQVALVRSQSISISLSRLGKLKRWRNCQVEKVIFYSRLGKHCMKKMRPCLLLTMMELSDLLAIDCRRRTIDSLQSRQQNTHRKTLVFRESRRLVQTGLAGELKADIDPCAETFTICGRWQKEDRTWKFARMGDIWGLSEIGVGGNDLSRSSGFRTYNENISASRFELPIDALVILTSFRCWGEADITVSTQAAPSDEAKLIQLFLGIFTDVKILQLLAVRICSMTSEPPSALNSCEAGGRTSDIS